MSRTMRVVPLAVLVAVVAVAALVRVKALGPKPRTAPTASAASAPIASAAASAEPSLGAPKAESPGAVVDHAPRMIHGDPHHTHRAKGHLPREAKVAWTYDTKGGMEAQVTASPDEQTLYVASLDGTVTALARDGKKKWAATLGDRVYATPCVADDGTVYVGSDAHAFVALTPEGRVKWRLETEGDADTGAAITKEGLVVFAAGSTVYAVRSGGDVAWRFKAKKKVFTAPAIADDGTIVFGAQDDHAYALKPSGALLWSVDLGADVDGAPAIADDGGVYVGTDANDVVRLSPAGEIAWRAKLGGYVRGPLSIARNGDVLAGVFGPEPREARVKSDGTVSGAFAVTGTGAREFGVYGGALEDDDGALLFGAQDDAVYAVEPTGRLRWRFSTSGDVDAPATLLTDGTVVLAADVGDGEGGRVYVLSP